MREIDIEEKVVEDYIDRQDLAEKEARSSAIFAVSEAMEDGWQSLATEDLEALDDFPDLLEGVDEVSEFGHWPAKGRK